MFWTWFVALVFGQVFLNRHLKIQIRIFLIGILFVTAYDAYVLNGDWKSGYVPALVAIAAIVAVRYPVITLALSPAAVIGFIWVATQAIATDTYSWGTRVDAWIVVMRIALISPILGMGFGNYSFYTRLFPMRGYYLKFNSHSQYVDIMAQTGFIGMMAFFWIIFAVGKLGLQLRDKVRDGFSIGYVYGVIGGIAGHFLYFLF